MFVAAAVETSEICNCVFMRRKRLLKCTVMYLCVCVFEMCLQTLVLF
uniref:Uncharacterized protein n=1 Tax=Anguilla anguilla TaxID=7936 RepID=A0A0E9WCK8_ANGAN